MSYQNATGYGDVIIPVSFSLSFFALLTILLLVLVCTFVYFGEYTRKAHLTGIIMPSAGLAKVAPQYSGYVKKLTAAEGQHVSAGEVLYHISGERYNGEGKGTLAAESLTLKKQYAMLLSQQLLESNDISQQQIGAHQHIESLQPQIKSAEQRLIQAEQQVRLSISTLRGYRELRSKHYISEIEYQQKLMELSSAKQNVEDQRGALLQLRSTLQTAEDNLSHLISQGKTRHVELEKQLQGTEQQQIELAGQEDFTLTSPVSGTVAAVLIRQGQSVKASEPVMTIIPDNGRLQIELYATSQNAGFIHPGQKVALRFAAFPYQKFGVQYGRILEISHTTLTPSDIFSVSPVTWKDNEGRYRVIVEPEHTYIMVYGKQERLRSGMILDGDVSLDTRNLWEWLTEPLWSLKGKM